MTAETRRWRCQICKAAQDSIDTPKMRVCEDCLAPVAGRLCHATLVVALETPGVDREYWMRKADYFVGPMMARWRDA